MSAPLAFTPNLPFGRLELRAADGGVDGEIPSWIVDRPDVLKALLAIHAAGGTSYLKRARDSEDVAVDVAAGTCRMVEPAW